MATDDLFVAQHETAIRLTEMALQGLVVRRNEDVDMKKARVSETYTEMMAAVKSAWKQSSKK